MRSDLTLSSVCVLGLAGVLALCSCGSPEPLSISAASPSLVCPSQRLAVVSLRGAGLPVPRAGEMPSLPKIELARRTLLSTMAASDAALAIDAAQVRAVSATQLDFDVTPGAFAAASEGPDLPPGRYDVKVTFNDGRSATREAALLAVPPPKVQGITPVPQCNSQGPLSVTLRGTGFVRQDGQLPQVRFTPIAGGAAVVLPANQLTGCADLPVVTGINAAQCTSLSIDIKSGTLAAGAYQVAVENPGGGCMSGEDVRFVVVPPPVIQEARSSTICTAQQDSQVVLAGSDFLLLPDADGGSPEAPRVTLNGRALATSATDCQAIPDGQGAQRCATLNVTVPSGSLPPGSYALKVQNPPGNRSGSCTTEMSLSLTAAPPPQVIDVTPAGVCAGGGTLALRGQDLRAGATVTLLGTADGDLKATTTVAADGRSASASFSGVFTPGGSYDLVLKNPDACQATAPKKIPVLPGPAILMVEPPAIPALFSTRLTVHTTGLTPPITAVALRKLDGTGSDQYLTFTPDPDHPSRVFVDVNPQQYPGTFNLVLRDSSTCESVLAAGVSFTTTTGPTVDGISPATATNAQTFTATIKGAGFKATPRVYLVPNPYNTGTLLAALPATVYRDQGTLTARIPTGLTSPSSYDVVVVNPDGTYGVKANAFKVTGAGGAAPVLSGISPQSVIGNMAQTVTVTGSAFRSPTATLTCRDGAGAVVNGATAMVTASAAGSATLTVNATGVVCTLRLTNADGTFGDYNGLGVTGAGLGLSAAVAGADLNTGRRAPGAAIGSGALGRFLYVAGGDTGTDAAPADTVEVAALGDDGALGPFQVLRTKLTGARSFFDLVAVGRFVYAVGGFTGSKATSDVLRAELLAPGGAPTGVDYEVVWNGKNGLPAGQYIYRVAAVMSAGDSNNPGGETLASEPLTFVVPQGLDNRLQLSLRWKAVAGASTYRVYRSPLAGAAAGGELLLGAVPANGDPSLGDTGAATPAAPGPLPPGALGAWSKVGALGTARAGAGAVAVQNPMDPLKYHLVVAGGNSGTLAAPVPLASVEVITLTLDASGNQTVSAPLVGPSLATARWAVRAVAGLNAQNATIPAGAPRVYVLPGSGAALTTLVADIDSAPVQAAGTLGGWVPAGASGVSRPGSGGFLLNNQAMLLGGFDNGAAGTAGDFAALGAPDRVGAFQSSAGLLGKPRALQGVAMDRGVVFQIGGASGQSGTAQASTERAFW